MDAITPLCAPFVEPGVFADYAARKAHGGTGGSPQEAYCTKNEYLEGIRIGHTITSDLDLKYVDNIVLHCRAITGNTKHDICMKTTDEDAQHGCPAGGGHGRRAPFEQPCPPGEEATGIHGRYGNYVDALGLICGSMIAAQPPPAARCASGYVWRERFDGDTVCVKPDERYRLADGGCRSGWVWRDTFDGDGVCVTPAQRKAAKEAAKRNHPAPGGVFQKRLPR